MNAVAITPLTNAQRRVFPVMGNTAHITVVGGSQRHLDFAQDRLARLEQLWSRFIKTSEISKLNSANGEPVFVHAETLKLVKYMIAGHQLTHGYFDPTVVFGEAKIGHSIDLIQIDETKYSVKMPKNMVLDPGAIGKGLAADIVATELMQQGVDGVCVNVGGDVRCIGTGDIDGHWVVGIESPFAAEEIVKSMRMLNGAVATSHLRAKIWMQDGVEVSHVINPLTGVACEVSSNRALQVSVLARECVWAEVFATALLVAGDKASFTAIDLNDLAALIFRADGRSVQSSKWAGFEHE